VVVAVVVVVVAVVVMNEWLFDSFGIINAVDDDDDEVSAIKLIFK
jgi:hypothetical protein